MYKVHTPTNALFTKLDKVLIFTLQITLTCSYIIIRFVIPVVFIIKLDWSLCICLTQLYDGRDMYRIYYIKSNYMFRHFTLDIFRLENEKT